MLSQTDSVHTSPGHSSAQPLRPSTGGLPDGLAHNQTVYVAFPRSQYYAPSATLRPLPPQVVQSPRDGAQRFPRSRDCPLYSGLGRSWTPIRCSLHPRRGAYACTPLAGTAWPIGPLARSVLEPSYATTHATLISSQRVHASDALNGASSRSHTGVQAGGLRVRMRCCRGGRRWRGGVRADRLGLSRLLERWSRRVQLAVYRLFALAFGPELAEGLMTSLC
jgi:hypothetical protein